MIKGESKCHNNIQYIVAGENLKSPAKKEVVGDSALPADRMRAQHVYIAAVTSQDIPLCKKVFEFHEGRRQACLSPNYKSAANWLHRAVIKYNHNYLSINHNDMFFCAKIEGLNEQTTRPFVPSCLPGLLRSYFPVTVTFSSNVHLHRLHVGFSFII